MAKLRNLLGLVAAVILLLSAGAHSFLGWPALHAQLDAAHATADLIRGVKIGWLFGGVCMLVFAIVLGAIFIARLRGQIAPAFPALVVGLAYLAFGTWALVTTGDAFFTIFLVPGAMAAIAAWR